MFRGPARESLRSGAWFPTQAARGTFLPYGGMARTPHNLDFLSGAFSRNAAAGLTSYSCVFTVVARHRRVAEGAGDIDVGVVVGLGVVAVVELAELQERLGDDVRFDVFEAPAEVLAAQIFERRIGCDVALADFELTRNCCT